MSRCCRQCRDKNEPYYQSKAAPPWPTQCQAERGQLPLRSHGRTAVAEGTIVTWRTDEIIPVGFGTIQVVPVWRFLLEMERKST